ncbi:MAG: hypothetical protein QXV06_06150 [Ignisphaera sp.]
MINLIEWQVVEVVEYGISRANALRNHGFSREADQEIVTSILTAIILSRAYCLYSYIDKETCIALEQTLIPLYITFVTAYKSATNSEFLDQINTLVNHVVQHNKAENIAYEVGVA